MGINDTIPTCACLEVSDTNKSLLSSSLLQESKMHRERELKAAEEGMVKARKEAEGVVKEAKTREQEMQALRLEVEELEKAVQTQQQQVGRKE